MIEPETNKKQSFLGKVKYVFTKIGHKNKLNKVKKVDHTNSEENEEVRKYDGFSDEEERMYAYSVGAQNIKQLNLIQKYNAPDYETAKKIISGNFKNYREYEKALKLGASNETQVQYIQKYKAPNLETALNIEKGGFQGYQQYQEAQRKGASKIDELKLLIRYNAPDMNALKMIQLGKFDNYEELEQAQAKGATNKEQLHLVNQMNVATYQEAKQILDSGFKDASTYNLALAKGLHQYAEWEKYLKERKEKIIQYKKLRKDQTIDKIMKEFTINDVRELLSALEPMHVSLMGDKVLFSLDYETYEEKGYSEFELNEIIGLDADNDICAICMRELVGPTGTCPKCQEKGHYDCMSTWIIDKHACPTCRKPLNVVDILLSGEKEKKVRHIKCFLCKKVINPLEEVIRCDACFTIYHKAEFLEYIKIKGFCVVCGKSMKFRAT